MGLNLSLWSELACSGGRACDLYLRCGFNCGRQGGCVIPVARAGPDTAAALARPPLVTRRLGVAAAPPSAQHQPAATLLLCLPRSRFAVLPIGEDNGIVEWVLSTTGLRHCIVSGCRVGAAQAGTHVSHWLRLLPDKQPTLRSQQRCRAATPLIAMLPAHSAPQTDMYTASGQWDGRSNRVIQKLYEGAPPVRAH